MEFSSLINFFTCKKNNDVSTVFENSKSAISADQAYQKSQFGCLKTDTELLNEFFAEVRSVIEQKNIHGKFSGIIEVNPDILQYMNKIVDKLTNELGYKCVVLDDNVDIVHRDTGVKCPMKTGSTFIVLIWSKEAIKDFKRNNYYVDIENMSKNVDN